MSCKCLANMAPEVGLEPTTLRLTAECSAIELLRIAWRTQATGRLLLNLYSKCWRVGQSGVTLVINCEQSPKPPGRFAGTVGLRRIANSNASSSSDHKG
jgi:hypothetical protein